MSIENEGLPTPGSIEAQALAELAKEGHDIEGTKPAEDIKPKEEKSLEEPKKQETPKEEPKKEELKTEDKPLVERKPHMVETWKLRVAEEQKESMAKELADLRSKVDELSKKGPIDQTKKVELADDIEAVIKKAEDAGTDGTILRELANSIINKVKPATDVLTKLQEERELEKQLDSYEKEFDSDVLPLVKEYNLSDDALSKIRKDLRDIAFSDTYAKVPLKEIFKIKADAFDLKTPKRSSETKSVKTRASDVVDLENIDEDTFKNLSPEQVEKVVQFKTTSSGWNRNRK